MQCEIWKDIIGYQDRYQISNFGNVKSLERLKKSGFGYQLVKESILKGFIDKQGYHIVDLKIDNIRKHFRVHRLVAIHFIPNPDNLPEVNHKDENPNNNHVDNLEWCDGKYNCNYGTRVERCTNNRDYDMIAKKRRKIVYQYDLQGNLIRVWESALEIKKVLGIDNSTIAKCCKSVSKQYSGFLWSYETHG